MRLMLEECGIGPADTVLVAFSGGADSTALLMLLCAARDEGTVSAVCAAHLNHGLRGAEADADEAFCTGFCLERGIPFRAGHADVRAYAREHKLSEETAAREVRYAFLNECADAFHANCIAVAHHRDDQAETVLMHLLRGSGTDGLCGMRPRTGRIVRPLLSTGRDEIESYLGQNGILYRTDSTNASLDMTRNRVRLELMPLMEKLNPMAAEHIASAAELIRVDADALREQAETALPGAALPDGGTDRVKLLKMPAAIRTRVLRLLLDGRVAGGLERVDIERLDALLTARSGTSIELRGGRSACVRGNGLYIGFPRRERAFRVTAVIPGETVFPGGSIIARESAFHMPANAMEAYVDAGRLPKGTVIRTRLEGDRFFPLGAPGERLLSDVMTDRKIPSGERDVPLLACDGVILWMPGYTVSELLRVTPKTERVMHLCYREDEHHE